MDFTEDCITFTLLILVIVIIGIVLFLCDKINSKNVAPLIVGGAVSLKPHITKRDQQLNRRIYIPDKSNIVVDGHNMIHSYFAVTNKTFDFSNGLDKISNILLTAFPNKIVHIVIKNTKPARKKSMPKKDINLLAKMSKKHPTVHYHLAYGNNKRSSRLHHLKARDDFLAIYIASITDKSFIISKDRFRDFQQFSTIAGFKSYEVHNGIIHPEQSIKPLNIWRDLTRPSIGNHFIYRLLKKLPNYINNGSVYLEDDSAFATVYLKL